MTKSEFARVMRYLAVALDREPSPDRLRIYWDLFGSLPAEVFQEAAREALLGSEYPTIPPPGVLNTIAQRILAQRARQERQNTEPAEPPISPEEHRKAWEIFCEARRVFRLPSKN